MCCSLNYTTGYQHCPENTFANVSLFYHDRPPPITIVDSDSVLEYCVIVKHYQNSQFAYLDWTSQFMRFVFQELLVISDQVPETGKPTPQAMLPPL